MNPVPIDKGNIEKYLNLREIVKEVNENYAFHLYPDDVCRIYRNYGSGIFYEFESIERMMIWLKIKKKNESNS